MTKLYTLYRGDCLEEMDRIPAGSVDAIIADLPYGTTACSWDTVIPFEPLWVHFKRVLKERGAVVLFGSQPFTSALVMSNPAWFKYCWVWDKRLAGNFLNARKMPLMVHEDLVVFMPGGIHYNPQMARGRLRDKGRKESGGGNGMSAYGTHGPAASFNDTYYPTSIIKITNGDRANDDNGLHPTQKPLALLEYLVKTYTNPGDTVLDCTMGSGTTGSACGRLNRRFIGIEKDEGYFEIAENRIKNAYGDFVRTPEEVKRGQMALFEVESVL